MLFFNGASRRAAANAGAVARQLACNERGSIKTLTGLLLIPVIVCVAYAIDYSRILSVRNHMQNAADAAALAAHGTGANAASVAQQAAEAYATVNSKALLGVLVSNVQAQPTSDGFKVELQATVPTPFASVIGYPSTTIKVSSESVYGGLNMEVALVLDNTGSMEGSMGDLKNGAKDLVEALHSAASGSSNLKMAVVPYAGAVNIGNGGQQMGWMDVNGQSDLSGLGLSWHWAGYETGCVYAPGGGGGGGPGSGTFGSLMDQLPRFANVVRQLLGIGTAQAATAADVPPGYDFYPNCWYVNPKVNFFTLFNQLNVTWKGCVMTRTDWGDWDVSDESPNNGDVNALFVPWFWPDTVDQTSIDAQGYGWNTVNNYIPDRNDLRLAAAPKFNDAWLGWQHHNLFKYPAGGGVAVIDEDGPDTLGPNKGCPDPLLPLTDSKSDVVTKIDGLKHWHGSGTNTAEGVAWGMRVLTPDAPFSEGSNDPDVKKVMVVMTDGVNNLNPSLDDSIMSEWSTYSYLWDGRIQPPTFEGFKNLVNARMAKACEIAKSKGIEIYTVLFNVTDPQTEDLMKQCATKPPYAYKASTSQELVESFREIGKSLTDLRLSK